MNRKLINGLLLLTLATGGVGSFTSCKDTEEDFRNQVLVGQGDLKGLYKDLEGKVDAIIALTQPDFLRNLDAEIDRKIQEGNFASASDLLTIKSDLQAANSEISKLWDAVRALQNKEEGGVTDQELADAINDLETRLTSQFNSALGDLKETVNLLQAALGDKVDTTTFNTTVNTINEAINNINTTLADYDQVKKDAADAIEQAMLNSTAIDILKSQIEVLQNKGVKMEGELAELTEGVGELYTKMEMVEGWIREYQNTIDEMGTNLNDTMESLTNLYHRFGQLEDQFNNFNQAYEDFYKNVMNKMAHWITSIEIERVVSPVFGSLDLPIGVSSRILFDYLFNSDHAIEFPALSGNAFAKQEFDPENGKYVDVAALNPQVYKFGTGDGMQLDNLGYVYVTVNPANVDFSGVRASLVNSLDEQVLADLKLEKVDELLTFGFTRANNGLYKAKVVPTENIGEDVAKIAIEAEPGLKTALKDAIKNHTVSDFTQLAKLLVKQFDGVLPAYTVKVEFEDNVQDENGNWVKTMNSVRAGYDMAATTFRPLSYATGFGFGTDREPLPTFGHVGYYIDKFFKGLNLEFKLNLTGVGQLDPVKLNLDSVKFQLDDQKIVVDLSGIEVRGEKQIINPDGSVTTIPDAVIGEIPAGTNITLTYNSDGTVNPVEPGDGALNDLVGEIVKQVNEMLGGEGDDSLISQINSQINSQLLNQVNSMLTDLNSQLEGLNGQIQDNIDQIVQNIKDQLNGKLGRLDKVIDKYNQFANKLNDMLKNPNHYLQIMMLYNTKNNGVHRLSTVATDPTRFSGNGVALDLYATSFNAEIAVPSYKKYVAITGVYSWQNGKLVKENANLTELNGNYGNSSLNKVLKGEQQHVIVPTSKMQKGKIYEIYYTSLDYRGFTSSQKYYVTL